MAVYPPDWMNWLLRPCVVRGRLIKRVPLPDGTTRDFGVCHACVKIYEVDKIPKIILKLPERDIFRLRDDLWKILEKRFAKPTVFPPPPLPPPREVIESAGPMTMASTEEMPHPGAWLATPVIPLPPPGAQLALTTETLTQAEPFMAEMEPVFRAASASQLRNVLVAKAEMLSAFICDLHWLWYWFHSNLIKCVCTDDEGRFETTIWYRCTGDKPDLYFKAVQCIGGTLHTLCMIRGWPATPSGTMHAAQKW